MLSRTLSAFIFMLLLVHFTPAHGGTFYNPSGESTVRKVGSEASAQLNEGIASLHIMYAALERRDRNIALKFKFTAESQLAKSLEQFSKLQSLVPESTLILSGRTPAETEILDQFIKQSLPQRKLEAPKTQKDLTKIAVLVVDDFLEKLKKSAVHADERDWTMARELIRSELVLEQIGLASSIIWSINNK